MSLYHSWMQAAQHANLSKNEWRVFNTVVMQTVGYCKSSDAINSKQWSKLCPELRSDRRNEAIQSLFDKRLIDVLEHDRFENEFFIPDHILEMGEIICPSLPKNRKSSPEIQGEITLKTGTYRQKDTTKRTTEKPTTSAGAKPEVLNGGGLVFPTSFSESQTKQACKKLDGLSPDQAQDCLDVLCDAIKAKNVRDPIAYLVGLTHKARKGELTKPSPSLPIPAKPSVSVERSLAKAESDHLAWLAKQGGVSVEALGGAV